jgi:hypothetical protein
VYGDHDGDSVRSVPYFLNPSILSLNEEFAQYLSRERRDWFVGDDIDACLFSWADLLTMARSFRASDAKFQNYKVFEFAQESQETLNCLFFEILYAQSGDESAIQKIFRNFHADDPFTEQERNDIIDSLRLLQDLLSERRRPVLLMGGQSSKSATLDSPALPEAMQDALICRHWYSTFRQMNADLRHGEMSRGPKLRICRLPRGVWCNGDWHLAILNGSIGPRRGLEIILEQFVNRDNALTMMNRGIGLSPFVNFYDKGGRLPVSSVPPRWFRPYVNGERVIYRGRFAGYQKYGQVLSFYLAVLANQPTNDDTTIHNLLTAMYQIGRRSASSAK